MAKLPRLPKKRSGTNPFADPDRGPVLSIRFVIALLLIVVGIAWVCYTYWGVRPHLPHGLGGAGIDPWTQTDAKGKTYPTRGPDFIGNLEKWNYLIGFVVLFLGLAFSAHPKTPFGRGRGVITMMLGCFVVGLLWICCYYLFLTGNNPKDVPLFNDLGQKNLFVGIGFFAVGFAFATRWE